MAGRGDGPKGSITKQIYTRPEGRHRRRGPKIDAEKLRIGLEVVRDGGARQKAGFGLAENKLGLGPESGNAPGMIGVEMREEHRLRVNVQARELCRQVHARLLPVGNAVGPIEQLHRLGVIAVGRMLREGVVEAVSIRKSPKRGWCIQCTNTARSRGTWSQSACLGLAGSRFRHASRSEERRVGKECRSRWSPTH